MAPPESKSSYALAEIDGRWPAYAPLARRLVRSDETFCAICEDYADALIASAQQKSKERPKPAAGSSRAAEYRVMAAELLEEAHSYLEKAAEEERNS